MSFPTCPSLDNYEFLGIVDKPKAGVTYKVRNLATGEFEVLRTLPGASSNHPESRERFLREIRVHTRLSHPNIVAFHNVLEMNGQLAMTAEYIEGSTMAQVCRNGALPQDEAVRVVRQVLAGLEEAHALGIVHRGITAEQVTITRVGFVKLGGFGLAKTAADMNLTQAGSILGDARYISPEQVMGVSAIDARSDLYSVGILLYQALTGRVPFSGSNDFDVMVAQVNTTPLPPSGVNQAVSPELDRIVLTALAKKPDDRFASAREFRLALDRVCPVMLLPRPAVDLPKPLPPPATVLPEPVPLARATRAEPPLMMPASALPGPASPAAPALPQPVPPPPSSVAAPAPQTPTVLSHSMQPTSLFLAPVPPDAVEQPSWKQLFRFGLIAFVIGVAVMLFLLMTLDSRL